MRKRRYQSEDTKWLYIAFPLAVIISLTLKLLGVPIF